MAEIVVAIVGMVGTLLAALLPPYLEHRSTTSTALTRPPLWAAVFFAALSSILLVITFFLALASGDSYSHISYLAFVECMVLAMIATTLAGFCSYRRDVVGSAVTYYSVGVLATVLLIHILIAGRGSEELSTSSTYNFLLFIVAAASGISSLFLIKVIVAYGRRPSLAPPQNQEAAGQDSPTPPPGS